MSGWTYAKWTEVEIANRDNAAFRHCRVRVKHTKPLRNVRWTNPFVIGVNDEVMDFPLTNTLHTTPVQEIARWEVSDHPRNCKPYRNPTGMDLSDFVVVDGPAW